VEANGDLFDRVCCNTRLELHQDFGWTEVASFIRCGFETIDRFVPLVSLDDPRSTPPLFLPIPKLTSKRSDKDEYQC
jgi:hypothetical protein